MNKQELINLIQRNENEGKLTFQTIEGICEASIKDFIKQSTEGILYDLNRDKATCISLIDQQYWINNYACALVIEALKNEIEELKDKLIFNK